MALSGAATKVVGLAEFRRELKKLDEPHLVNQLKDVNYAVASLVVSSAKAHASTRMESAAAESLRPSRSGARAQVTGGAGIEFFGGAEFGAAQDQIRNTARGAVTGWNQFQPWRGSGSGAGYFLYPAIRDETEHIVDMYGDALEKIASQAFPD